MKILELFSGYGTASFALKQLGIDFEIVGYSDIDKYANQCFRQNHSRYNNKCDWKVPTGIKPKELGDCTKINPNDLEDFDLLTGGFPCQAFSVAGKGLGELDTRGTLFNEIIRIAEVKQPRYMMLENVKGLMSKKHKQTFDKIISELYRIGYFVKWQVMNTKEHGIPQNRERVFFVCFKSWTDFCNYEWAEKEELKLFLKDILEEDVNEKYYLSVDQVKRLLNPNVSSFRSRNFVKNNISQTLQSAMSHGNTIPLIYDTYNNKIKEDGICITLTEPHHNNLRLLEPLLIKNATKKGYIEGYKGDGVNLDFPGSNTRRGRVIKNCCGTLQCNEGRGVIVSVAMANKNRGKIPYDKNNREYHLEQNKEDGVSYTVKSSLHEFMATDGLTIRKLTPLECFRLQGFLDDEVNLEGLSNTQRYKLAGNGQSVNVVKKIFCSLNLNSTNEVQDV